MNPRLLNEQNSGDRDDTTCESPLASPGCHAGRENYQRCDLGRGAYIAAGGCNVSGDNEGDRTRNQDDGQNLELVHPQPATHAGQHPEKGKGAHASKSRFFTSRVS